MSDSPPSGGGLFDSLRQLLDSALATVASRIELFTVELQEEKCRLIELVVLCAVVLVCGLMSILLITATVVYLLPEENRWIGLVLLCLVYLTGTVLAWLGLQKRLHGHAPFSGTIEELKKDRECLKARN